MMKCPANKRPVATICSVMALTAAGHVHAQGTARDLPSVEDVEEIVVTAQKRLQNAQDVGISIAVVDPTQLRDMAITSPTAIADGIPSLRIDSPGPVNATYNLRGVSTRDINPHNEGAVAFFNDGVYISSGQATTSPLFDLERIEVLKGPQGTLFGRNATGGLIHVISRTPSREFDAYAQATGGSYNQYGFEGAMGGPLSESLAGRLSLFTNQRDGFITNQNGPDQEGLESYAGRAQLLFQPSEELDVLFSGRYSTYQPQPARGYDSKPLIVDASGAARAPTSQAEYAAYCTSLFAGVGGVPNGVTVAPPGALQRGNCFFAQPSTDTLTTSANNSSYSNDYAAGSVTVDWRFSETVSLTSISDFQDFTSDYLFDVDGSPLQLFNLAASSDIVQYSQELRLNGDAGSVRWTAGVYYLGIEGDFVGTFDTLNNPAFLSIAQVAPYAVDTRSYAGFAHVEYDFLPKWTVIVGARWTEDEKELRQQPSQCTDLSGGALCSLYANVLFPGTLAFAGYQGKIDKGDWAGKLMLNWKPADGQLVYAGVNRGNKVGSFNAGPGLLISPNQVPYDNEVLTSYEIGVKSTLPGDAVIVNGSVFYYDYQDYQTYSVLNAALQVFNTDATVEGAEIEITARPIERVTLKLSTTFVEAVQTDLVTATGVRDVRMPGAPKWSAYASTRYDWPVSFGSFDVMLDGAYVGERSSDAQDPVALRSPSYVRANASVGFESPSNQWNVRAWVKNFTDRDVLNFTANLAVIDGGYELIWEEGRTYGMSVGYNWR